ncbi:hypothetical protein [Sphingomonas asaccharolytica]|uniref:hypothetical protein n=1 Tax=Sphingomonas asaccharolytica TaxID=40681 RepID=UPI000B204350|nr:hypothetical protein [Sphingomonas asaccharolytica]
MGAIIPLDRLEPMFRAIPSLPRPVLARLTEKMIERLDQLDGDPDAELNGDEEDSNNAEDDFFVHEPTSPYGDAGCPISDPPEDGDADRCQAGDDGVFSGPGIGYPVREGVWGPGDPEDGEP